MYPRQTDERRQGEDIGGPGRGSRHPGSHLRREDAQGRRPSRHERGRWRLPGPHGQEGKCVSTRTRSGHVLADSTIL